MFTGRARRFVGLALSASTLAIPSAVARAAEAPGDPAALACSQGPGEAIGLEFVSPSGNLSWSPPAAPGGTPLIYDTLRSTSPTDFGAGATCVESNDGADTAAVDPAVPPPGVIYFYSVRPENPCGMGPMGFDSQGMPRAQGRECGPPCSIADPCGAGFACDPATSMCTLCQASDEPDLLFSDANCDGLDGNEGLAIFVDAVGGSDANPGTRAAPMATIGAGISAAATGLLPQKDVFISTGTYPETVTLSDGVRLYGGYDAADGWSRAASHTTTISSPTSIGVFGFALDDPMELQLLAVTATTAAAGPGVSGAGVVLVDSPGPVILRALEITAPDGTPGSAGTVGQSGEPGGAGGNALSVTAGVSGVSAAGAPGGAGAPGVPCTGAGQQGGSGTQAPGGGTGATGGAGGTSGSCTGVSSSNGGAAPPVTSSGGAGAAGINGAPGAAVGSIDSSSGLYLPVPGGAGGTGLPGGGGAGGGSGGGTANGTNAPFCTNCTCLASGAGGGGGGGGQGGTGGSGGLGGGGSFAVIAANSTVIVEQSRLVSGSGGSGGSGGAGGAGGHGGSAGSGAPGASRSTSCSTRTAGTGAAGSAGGPGGQAGGGAGGTGGPSACVAWTTSAPMLSGIDCTHGPGGAGGQGGSGGSGTGATGTAGVSVLSLPAP